MQKNTEIYIVRHGDSDKTDPAGNQLPDDDRVLSETGIQDVSALAQHLHELGVSPNVIISSFIPRAIQTADIIAEKLGGVPRLKSNLIGETKLGTLSNSKESLISVDYGYDTEKMVAAGGETVAQVETRVREFLDQLDDQEYGSVIVVSHGLTLSVMSQLLQNLDLTFANIQALRTADYSYFLIQRNESGQKTTAVTNALKGKPNLT